METAWGVFREVGSRISLHRPGPKSRRVSGIELTPAPCQAVFGGGS